MKSSLENLFLLFSLLLLVNCSNDKITDEVDISQISQERIDAVLEMTTESEQRLSYSLLNEYEQASIWIDKMDLLIKDQKLYGVKVNLTSSELNLIAEIRDEFKPYIFSDKENDQKEYFKNIYAPDFIKRASATFTNNYLMGMIFYEISIAPTEKLINDIENSNINDLISAFNSRDDGFTDVDPDADKECNCDQGAFFTCAWGQDETCKDKKCKYTPDNCGFAWAWECDGICKI